MATFIPSFDQDARQKWNARYQHRTGAPVAAQVLRDYVHLLPATGTALDVACGLGGNAVLLAEQGLETWAWDVSDVAIERLLQVAQQRHLPVHAEWRDVVVSPPTPESFDVIVVSRFLARPLLPALVAALRPHGLLFYQTFTALAVEDVGPQQPAYRLAAQELLTLLQPLRVVLYREEGDLGDVRRGVRNEVMYIGHNVPQERQESWISPRR